MVVVLVLAALAGVWKFAGMGEPGNIHRPVYLALRTQLKLERRAVDMLFFLKTASDKDCKKQRAQFQEGIDSMEKAAKAGTFSVVSDECVPELEKRFALLFEDLPMPVTYISAPRNRPQQRELRAMFLGVSREESDQVCTELIKVFERTWGKAQCVRAAR